MRVIIDNWVIKDEMRGLEILISNLPRDHKRDIFNQAMPLARSPEAKGMPGYLASAIGKLEQNAVSVTADVRKCDIQLGADGLRGPLG